MFTLETHQNHCDVDEFEVWLVGLGCAFGLKDALTQRGEPVFLKTDSIRYVIP